MRTWLLQRSGRHQRFIHWNEIWSFWDSSILTNILLCNRTKHSLRWPYWHNEKSNSHWASLVLLFLKVNTIFFLILWSRFLKKIMKIHYFWGGLTDISARNTHWASPCRSRCHQRGTNLMRMGSTPKALASAQPPRRTATSLLSQTVCWMPQI